MPGRNIIKPYIENGFYHLYNRGVNKNLIFLDEQDYSVFLLYLKQYLLPKDEKQLRSSLLDPTTGYREKDKILKLLRLNNFFGEIILIAYCLMPNHFHFLLQQKSSNSIDRFISSLCTRYTMYFNRKYHRVGPLYQSIFKAALIESDDQLLHLSRYIHNNPESLKNSSFLQPSSLPEYLGQRKTEWVNPKIILDYFSNDNSKLSYQSFINQSEDLSVIVNHLLD